MTIVEFKKEERIIKKVGLTLRNNKKKARVFLFKIGLVNKNGLPKNLSRKD